MKKDMILKFLEVLAENGTCTRMKTSAIIIKDKTIISMGYNGSVRGAEECKDKGCLIVGDHCERAIHAEENAIINSARIGVPLIGATIYCLHFPCKKCLKVICNSGIKKIVWFNDYEDELNKELSRDYRNAGIIEIEKGVI